MPKEYVVASIDALPEGTHKVFQVGGREIGIFNVAGKFYALPDHCAHQNGPLCKGVVTGTLTSTAKGGWKPTWEREGEIVICPWHSMEFDITSGRCLSEPRRRIPTYQVTVVDSQITITIP